MTYVRKSMMLLLNINRKIKNGVVSLSNKYDVNLRINSLKSVIKFCFKNIQCMLIVIPRFKNNLDC